MCRIIVPIQKNTLVMREAKPHNKCVGESYFIVKQNQQFMIMLRISQRGRMAFFKCSPLEKHTKR